MAGPGGSTIQRASIYDNLYGKIHARLIFRNDSRGTTSLSRPIDVENFIMYGINALGARTDNLKGVRYYLTMEDYNKYRTESNATSHDEAIRGEDATTNVNLLIYKTSETVSKKFIFDNYKSVSFIVVCFMMYIMYRCAFRFQHLQTVLPNPITETPSAPAIDLIPSVNPSLSAPAINQVPSVNPSLSAPVIDPIPSVNFADLRKFQK